MRARKYQAPSRVPALLSISMYWGVPSRAVGNVPRGVMDAKALTGMRKSRDDEQAT
jgi:hypothetical protein